MNSVIYSKNESNIQEEAMYWSNEWGWTSLEFADTYSDQDATLPQCGEWMKYSDAKELTELTNAKVREILELDNP